MNVPEENGTKAMNDVTAWLEAGHALRLRLVSERERLIARVAEIDQALAALPSDQDTSDSTPERVRRVLRGVPGPVTAPQVIEAIRTTDPVIEPRLVHSALHRLVKKGQVLAQGETGARVYRLACAEEKTMST